LDKRDKGAGYDRKFESTSIRCCRPLKYRFCKLSPQAENLPDHVVDANSLKRFETRLDKFWRDQDVMFDWTAEITGTGDRSEFKLETVLEKKLFKVVTEDYYKRKD